MKNQGVTHVLCPKCCIKLTISGKLDFNDNFHRILAADWLWCFVAMVVTIESIVIINGKFYATGPRQVNISNFRGVEFWMPVWHLVPVCFRPVTKFESFML